MTRALLGVPGDQSGPSAGVPFGHGGRGAGGHGGWFGHDAEPGVMPAVYGSSVEMDWDQEPPHG